jgi:hypothetical protein
MNRLAIPLPHLLRRDAEAVEPARTRRSTKCGFASVVLGRIAHPPEVGLVGCNGIKSLVAPVSFVPISSAAVPIVVAAIRSTSSRRSRRIVIVLCKNDIGLVCKSDKNESKAYLCTSSCQTTEAFQTDSDSPARSWALRTLLGSLLRSRRMTLWLDGGL